MKNQLQAQFPLTKAVRAIIVINVVIWFFLQVLMEGYGKVPFSHYMGLYPEKVLHSFSFWQLFSYMFLHSIQVSHILFNMLMLWFMGGELELKWGTRFFTLFYILSGAGAALIYTSGMWIYATLSGNSEGLYVPVLGASGAIFGLMVAYGLIFGERVMYFMMLFPIKARYFVMVLGGIELISLITSGINGGDVAYLAHIGGLISGYLLLKAWQKFQIYQWNKTLSKKTRNLKLVVDNENPKNPGEGPRYWN